MPSCCGSATCACKIQAGNNITIAGSGTANDPFVLSVDLGIAVTDNEVFDLTLSGTGQAADPWTFEVAYASTATLHHIPDVEAPAPTNGQVLGWDSATSKWTPRAPTTAAAGAVSHDTSLTGDGSAGAPLAVSPDAARGVATSAAGVGLSDTAVNSLVRGFVDATARTAATNPVPDLNTLTMLDTNPGAVDYWDGVAWAPIRDNFDTVISGQFMAISGVYNGSRVTHVIGQVLSTSDANGVFDVLAPALLAGYAGVLTCQFQESSSTVAWKATVFPNSDRVSGVAWRLDDGTPFASQALIGTVNAWLY